MALRDELRDPWGWLVAGVAGGLTWAVGTDAAAAVAVAAGVLGVKVALGTALNRAPKQRRDALPSPRRGSPESVLLGRCQRARAAMAQHAQRPADPWLRTEVGRMDDGAGDVEAAMRDLAGRVALADELLGTSDPSALLPERTELARALAQTADPGLAVERQRALAALDEQLAGLQRLTTLREQLLARMQTATIGLETVATRMGEVVALGSDAFAHDRASEIIGDASNDLESLRTGLAEAQRLARGVE